MYIEALARDAKALGVYMTHATHEGEFMSVLSYRVDQYIAAHERKLAALKALRDRYTA